MSNIVVTGATGFVGRQIVAQLLQAGHQVHALSRSGKTVAGSTGHAVNITDPQATVALIRRLQPDVVVHLVGIIAEKAAQTFEALHIEATRNVLTAIQDLANVRYLHMSALGANLASSSRYMSSKAAAEALLDSSGLAYTIFRPSIIFGKGDDFFGGVLKNLVSQAPVVPQIGDGSFPFRPISVQDVATAFVQAIERPATIGQTYSLVGPEEFNFRQLLQLETQALGMRKPLVPVPVALMNLLVPLMQVLPQPPITTDQYAMLLQGNTADPQAMLADFQLPMRSLRQDLADIVRG